MLHLCPEWVCFSGYARSRSNWPSPNECHVLMSAECQEEMGVEQEATAPCHRLTLVCLSVLGNPHWPGNLPTPSDGFCVLFSWFLPGRVLEEVNICQPWVINTWCWNQSCCLGWAGRLVIFYAYILSTSVSLVYFLLCTIKSLPLVLWDTAFFWINWYFIFTWQPCCSGSFGSASPLQPSLGEKKKKKRLEIKHRNWKSLENFPL